MDPTALFKQYEADYCNKSTDASRKITVIESLNGDARRRKVQEVEADLRSAEDVIKRMDMEARSLPMEQSRPLLVNVKGYKADLVALKEQVKRAAASTSVVDAARAELATCSNGLGGADYHSSSAGQRDKMLTATQRLEKTNDVLQYGREQLQQTEDLGASILQNLHSQRETIMHSKDTLASADDNISKARKLLSDMTRRMMQNKLIMAGVILFLLAGIAIIIWAKMLSKLGRTSWQPRTRGQVHHEATARPTLSPNVVMRPLGPPGASDKSHCQNYDAAPAHHKLTFVAAESPGTTLLFAGPKHEDSKGSSNGNGVLPLPVVTGTVLVEPNAQDQGHSLKSSSPSFSLQRSNSGNSNGASTQAAASNGVVRIGPNGLSSSSSSSSSSSRPAGMVVARTSVASLMPAVRAAAAEAAAQLPSHTLPPTTLQPSSYPPPSTLAATSNQVALEFSQSQPINERPEEADFRWAQEQYSATQRSLDTWTFFSVFRARLWLLDQKWSYLGGFSEAAKKERTRSLARYLLASVLNLGPTFIKLGQLSSTRSDLFPQEFVAELSQLQDRVPAFSAQKAMAIIEADLGRPVARLFKSWDPRPIAAASLGQVHRAVLWTGEEVVVKVQRPGLRQLFDIDLNNLKLLAEQLDKADEDNRDFRGIYKECAKVLYEEIDYIAEGRNSDRFRRNFRDVPWVRVPKVYWEYCSPRVLTMEYLPGVKISSAQQLQAAGLDCDTVARRATEAYLIQILKHGFFHADPHPGNVSVDIQGNLLFYVLPFLMHCMLCCAMLCVALDFGMMGEIVPGIKDKLLDTFYGIYKQDTQAVINALIALGVIKPTGDALTLRRAIGYFINNLARQTERQETIQAIGEDLFSIAVDQPFRFPATFTFVLRAFSTLEGIGKSLNPTYRFTDVATPYAQELLQLQVGTGPGPGPVEVVVHGQQMEQGVGALLACPQDSRGQQSLLVSQLQQQATELGVAAAAMPQRVARMSSLLEQLEAGEVKLRVRVLEAERAARRAGVMQAATLNVVGGMGFVNVATVLGTTGHEGPALACLLLGCVFGVLTWRGFVRVERLDKFEKDLRG
ncbi:hypothetical protein QJQ45_024089 [Haematococcus lacustris]|nr:hypothetical protein QJQ45_024089 [Haematococcus lacustris]